MTVMLEMFLFPSWKKPKENTVAASSINMVKTVSNKIFFFICVNVYCSGADGLKVLDHPKKSRLYRLSVLIFPNDILDPLVRA